MSLDIKGVKVDIKNSLITDIFYYKSLKSTNKFALELKDAKEGTVIIAERQTKGRGRLQRKWYSPSDAGLYFSIILKPKKNYNNIPLLTLIGALSVYKTLNTIKIKTDLKWPNDILYKNKKVCGVLSQFRSSGSNLEKVVVGIGLNVNQKKFPEKLKSKSISLRMIKNKKIKKEGLLIDILDNFSIYYKKFKEEKFEEIIEEWKDKMKMLNKIITFSTSDNKKILGKVIDISAKGELIIKHEDGETKRLIAGDVSVDKNSLRFK